MTNVLPEPNEVLTLHYDGQRGYTPPVVAEVITTDRIRRLFTVAIPSAGTRVEVDADFAVYERAQAAEETEATPTIDDLEGRINAVAGENHELKARVNELEELLRLATEDIEELYEEKAEQAEEIEEEDAE